jgi:hypothetical protein
MDRGLLTLLRRATLLAAALVVLALPGSASAARGLVTGLQDFDFTPTHFERIKASGSGVVKISLVWRDVAPVAPPASFNPADPLSPAYTWEPFDSQVRAAVAVGLNPLLTIEQAPGWAERDKRGSSGTGNPDPLQFGLFAEAVARRYSGAVAGLPRVRMFEAWNEPNASFFLFPPRNADGSNYTPGLYREMVNRFATGVHRVHADNVVVAGALFPFTLNRAGAQTIGPDRFMREVLCLSEKLKVVPGCGPTVQFDAWSHHPYTSGDATHKAGHRDSISLGDLPRMQKVLRAAVRQKRIVSRGSVKFWITEFGWDTAPADPKGVPLGLHARWVSEALYRSWNAGVSLFVWYRLRDGPPTGPVQSGLWLRCATGIACDQPKKASLKAFRFPFVAFRSGKRVRVWGRTPGGVKGSVTIQASGKGGYKALRKLRSDSAGIFKGLFRGPRKGHLRARLGGKGEVSVPFSLKRPPDRPVNPFGSTS